MYLLNPASGVPLYRQIVDQTRLLVAAGRLAPGRCLPSVRTMAADLDVNPMTVSKAYSLLEQAGIVARRRGIGMVVTEAGLDVAEAIGPDAAALIRTARQLGMSRSDLFAKIEKLWEET